MGSRALAGHLYSCRAVARGTPNMTKHMNRRIFLRGLGGAVVAAPFLSSLSGRGVKAQPAPAPRRLIVLFTP